MNNVRSGVNSMVRILHKFTEKHYRSFIVLCGLSKELNGDLSLVPHFQVSHKVGPAYNPDTQRYTVLYIPPWYKLSMCGSGVLEAKYKMLYSTFVTPIDKVCLIFKPNLGGENNDRCSDYHQLCRYMKKSIKTDYKIEISYCNEFIETHSISIKNVNPLRNNDKKIWNIKKTDFTDYLPMKVTELTLTSKPKAELEPGPEPEPKIKLETK